MPVDRPGFASLLCRPCTVPETFFKVPRWASYYRSMEGQGDEADLPAQSNPPQAASRLSGSNEDPRRPGGVETPPGKGAKAPGCDDRFKIGMFRRSGGLPRARRLRNHRDFRRVSQQGRRSASRHFVLLAASVAPSREGNTSLSVIESQDTEQLRLRLGVTVSKAVGNAVTRNRVKRLIRAWFRDFSGKYANLSALNADLVVIARPSAASLRSGVMFSDLSQLAKSQLAGSREANNRG